MFVRQEGKLPDEESFDSNCITPGTEFMFRLGESRCVLFFSLALFCVFFNSVVSLRSDENQVVPIRCDICGVVWRGVVWCNVV